MRDAIDEPTQERRGFGAAVKHVNFKLFLSVTQRTSVISSHTCTEQAELIRKNILNNFLSFSQLVSGRSSTNRVI